ncbi:hypothetical protein ACWETN_13170 [Staphylococcus xylosus]
MIGYIPIAKLKIFFSIYNIEGVIQIAARGLVRVVASCSFG